MTQPRDIERLLDQWLADGSRVAPDRVIDVVADRIERQSQRSAWRLDWRHSTMPLAFKTGIGVAAVLVVAIVGLGLVLGGSSIGVGAPSAIPSASIGAPVSIRRASSVFKPALTLSVPEHWQNTSDYPFLYSVGSAPEGQGPPTIDVYSQSSMVSQGADCGLTEERGATATVDEWVSWLTTRPGLVAGAPRKVEVGGYQGQTIELRVAPEWTQVCETLSSHPGVYLFGHAGGLGGFAFPRGIGSDSAMTLSILDVAGQTVLVAVETPTAETTTRSLLATTQPIIDSFRFAP